MIRFYLFLFLVFINGRTLSAQGCSFNITYSGTFPAPAINAFNYATGVWSYNLNSAVPIKINAVWFSYSGGPLAITFSNGRKDFPAAAYDSTWYPTSLANAMSGSELNPGEYDMDIFVNGAYPWYNGTDGMTPAGQYDLMSTIIHEIGHGLGFTSVCKKEGSVGSIGMVEMSDFAPVVTSFPWPDQDTMPGIYDIFIRNLGGMYLTSFANPSTALGSQLTGNQLYWDGPYTLAANSGNPARLHAPGAFVLGTCVLHLNESTYPTGHAEELMTPYMTTGTSQHTIGPMTIAMLKDMGWVQYIGIEENQDMDLVWNVWPNPARHEFQVLQLPHGKNNVMLFNPAGEIVRTMTTNASQLAVKIDGLTPGLYLVCVENERGKHTRKLVIQP